MNINATTLKATKTSAKSISGPLLPPQAPAAVSAVAQSTSSISVSWNASNGADGYRVFRRQGTTGTFTQIGGDRTATSFVDTGLTANTTYQYQVRAFNEAGESANSAATGQATTLLAIPNVPTGVNVNPQSPSSIQVSWGAVTGATSYRVYRRTASWAAGTLVGTVTTTSFTDTGLNANAEYFYSVSAVNSAGESSQSSIVGGRTWLPVPATPSISTVSAQSSSNISISWNPVTHAAGYRLFRRLGASGNFVQIGGDITGTSFNDTGLSASTSYTYYLVAFNNSGVSANSTQVSTSTQAAPTVPATPTGVTAQGLDHRSIQISWNAVSGATRYNVGRNNAQFGSFPNITGSNHTQNWIVDTNLNPNTDYWYLVVAVNSVGNSQQSATVKGTTLSPKAEWSGQWNDLVGDFGSGYINYLSAYFTQEHGQNYMRLELSGFVGNNDVIRTTQYQQGSIVPDEFSLDGSWCMGSSHGGYYYVIINGGEIEIHDAYGQCCEINDVIEHWY